ncbi:MAG: hypothetical protein EOR81_30590 [Mesorhizobium sp.]|nr:MAG: hypothetical protein EOR81_30590 [Mesorhizobium sp.]
MPNTHVPAAGEAMPAANVSRRLALLGGLSAAAALAALPRAHATPAEHLDAELFRLDREMEEAEARMEAASDANCRAGSMCEKLYPPRPPEWKRPSTPDHVLDILADMSFNDRKAEQQPEPVRAWYKACAEQKSESEALWKAYKTKVEEIDCEAGMDGLEDAYNDSVDAMWQVGHRIFATPADTLDGIIIKIRAGDRMGAPDANEAFLSIAADVRRLAAAEATS